MVSSRKARRSAEVVPKMLKKIGKKFLAMLLTAALPLVFPIGPLQVVSMSVTRAEQIEGRASTSFVIALPSSGAITLKDSARSEGA